MKEKITKLLTEKPGRMAREIARALSIDRTELNAFLHRNMDFFTQDDKYQWYLTNLKTIRIELPSDTWVDADAFEESLKKTGSPLDIDSHVVQFVVPKECKILLEAAARLLALCNQTIHIGKRVTVDFSDCKNTLGYFNRIGFFDHLNRAATVIPSRPTVSKASQYRENSENVLEFGEIDIAAPNEDIPEHLKLCFVKKAGESYSQPAFTVISELFGNVRDHSKSPIPGFTALQAYSRPKRHIQTIISDSGKGIVGTLKPVFSELYPELAKKFDFSDPKSEARLVKHLFEKGGISSTREDGHGLGLNSTRKVAAAFNASISIRQETFEVKLVYENNKLSKQSSYKINMPRILGTHVCVDFLY